MILYFLVQSLSLTQDHSIVLAADITYSNTLFYHLVSANNGYGGAIRHISAGSNVSILGCIFDGCYAPRGGAIYISQADLQFSRNCGFNCELTSGDWGIFCLVSIDDPFDTFNLSVVAYCAPSPPNNKYPGKYGSAIYFESHVGAKYNLSIHSLNETNNFAPFHAPTLKLIDLLNVSVKYCTFSNCKSNNSIFHSAGNPDFYLSFCNFIGCVSLHHSQGKILDFYGPHLNNYLNDIYLVENSATYLFHYDDNNFNCSNIFLYLNSISHIQIQHAISVVSPDLTTLDLTTFSFFPNSCDLIQSFYDFSDGTTRPSGNILIPDIILPTPLYDQTLLLDQTDTFFQSVYFSDSFFPPQSDNFTLTSSFPVKLAQTPQFSASSYFTPLKTPQETVLSHDKNLYSSVFTQSSSIIVGDEKNWDYYSHFNFSFCSIHCFDYCFSHYYNLSQKKF